MQQPGEPSIHHVPRLVVVAAFSPLASRSPSRAERNRQAHPCMRSRTTWTLTGGSHVKRGPRTQEGLTAPSSTSRRTMCVPMTQRPCLYRKRVRERRRRRRKGKEGAGYYPVTRVLRPCKRVMRVLATNKKNTLMKRSIKEEREGRSERDAWQRELRSSGGRERMVGCWRAIGIL